MIVGIRAWAGLLAALGIAGCGASVSPEGAGDAGRDSALAVDAAPATDAVAAPDAAAVDVAPAPQDVAVVPGHCYPYEPTSVMAPSVLMC
jgi:hypothetical protein